jgi:phage tail tape-measure protein
MNNDLVLNLRIRANADGTAQVLGQTGDGIRRVSTESGNASRALRGMESAASGLIRTIAPLIGIYELISFGHKVVEDTATVQDLDTRLHSLTKTAGDYAQTVDYITTVAMPNIKKSTIYPIATQNCACCRIPALFPASKPKACLKG